MFNIGDFVIGKPNNGYRWTNKNAYMKVIQTCEGGGMTVVIIARESDISDWGNACGDGIFNVLNDSSKFEHAPFWNEWIASHNPDFYHPDYESYLETYTATTIDTTVTTAKKETKIMDLKMVKNEFNIPQEQLNYYADEIMGLLPKYRFESDKHYKPNREAINKLLEEYNKEKGWLYPYFMSHPNYIGNGKIAFTSDYHRKVNVKGVKDFINWMIYKVTSFYQNNYTLKINGMTCYDVSTALSNIAKVLDGVRYIQGAQMGQAKCSVKVNGLTYSELLKEKERLENIKNIIQIKGKRVNDHYYSKKRAEELSGIKNFCDILYDAPTMLVTEDKVELSDINNYLKPIGLSAAPNQKYSRLIGKLCKKIGIDKDPEYLPKFTKLGDDINEISVRRHTIISMNPVDYLTMSFGNTWSSCHTIDKLNDRGGNGQTYSGCYSGGTLSYMLDESTVIYYTVDKKYDGTDFEFQPKVNRCVFNIGEDKLIQGRVYPQANDGDKTIYEEIRTIMQKVVSEMFKVNNLWINKKGCDACDSVVESEGAHYRDYVHYSDCNVSYLKPEEGKTKNPTKIKVGHKGICITCGKPINRERFIVCADCEEDLKICPHCGRHTREDLIEIDGQYYCSNCAFYCNHHQRWEIDTHYKIVATNVGKNMWGVGIANKVKICKEAFESEKGTRYKYAYDVHGYWIDTEAFTTGVTTGDNHYYAFASSIPEGMYKTANNGKLYHKDNLKYDRHIKQYVPETEWNYSLKCWNGIADQVREHNEMLARRAERRLLRQARREAETAA